jgi:glyoxylate reductase
MARIFVTRDIPRSGPDLLRERFGDDSVAVFAEDRVMRPGELRTAVAGSEALLCNTSDKVDGPVFNAAGSGLRIIATYSVGLDHINLHEAAKRRVVVTNTPDVLTETTADMTWALLMSLARRVVEADRYIRGGSWKGWRPHMLLGVDVHGKTLGIFGMGRIGQAVARRASGFSMRILYTDAQRLEPAREKELGVVFVDKNTLLAESDFLSIHCPLTLETRHVFSTREFQTMKSTACLINAARGPIVDEQALVEALKREEIRGAGLDVFEHSPKVHPDLLYLENVVLSPHIGSASIETREKMSRMAAESIVACLNGDTPPHCVNPEIL